MEDHVIEAGPNPSPEAIRRAAVLPDHHILTRDDHEIVAHVLGGQQFACTAPPDGGAVVFGAFGQTFQTMGQLRDLAVEHPPEPSGDEGETVGIDMFGNMLDTIAFLRVRLRALADACIERGVISGPELLSKYNEAHERSFEAFRDLMLLRPEVFEQRFASWLKTERDYREFLERGGLAAQPAPAPRSEAG